MLNKTDCLAILAMAICLLSTACSNKQQEVEALVKLEERYPELQKKYVYQSLIRLANVNRDPDFEKLIKDVRKVILYMPPREDSLYQITEVRSDIRKEGFEELLDIRTDEAQRINLFVKEYNNTAHYVALVDSDDEDIILEIDGEIHPEYLSSIAKASQSSLTDLLKGGF